MFFGVLITVFVVAWLLTGGLRRYALSMHMVDVPNSRSSHAIPTPRGGGIAIVVGFLGSLIFLAAFGAVDMSVVTGLCGGGVLVALVGFSDDHGHIAPLWRLIAHCAASAWILYSLGGLPPITAFGMAVELGMIGLVLFTVYMVWMQNLYNFMDGIDGIAGIEAITAGIGGCVLYYLVGAPGSVLLVPSLLVAAVSGFLLWNFPKARIFMGDGGSGFLGLMLVGMSVQAAWVNPDLLWAWQILLGVFIVDATVTLIRRVLRGERFYKAHRSHAYQYASRRYGSHMLVTLAVGALNLFWLLPVAAVVVLGMLSPGWGLLIAYIPLFILALIYKAGAAEQQEM